MTQDATFDTSFWANAFRVGMLPYVLDRLTLHYAPDVAGELPETNPPGREFRRLVRDRRLHRIVPRAQRIRDFGDGERAAMNVAAEHPDWTLLIDDYRAYRAGLRLGLDAICSPSLAVTMYHEGELTNEQVLTFLFRLERIGTVSPHHLDSAWDRYEAHRRPAP